MGLLRYIVEGTKNLINDDPKQYIKDEKVWSFVFNIFRVCGVL